MSYKYANSIVARFPSILLFTLLVAGCTLQRFPLTPTLVSVPTVTMTLPNPKTPSIPSQVPTATMPADLLAALQIVVTAIETNQPDMLRLLIDDEGVAVVGLGQGENFKGYNNSDEIVAAFIESLDQSTPSCEGFVPNAGALPDKAILVYRGLKFDWGRFGLSSTSSDGMTLQLFKLSEGWRLVYITPFDFESGSPILGPLQDCPAVHQPP